MCGLAGLISYSAPLQDEHLYELSLIIDRLKPRGPDAQKIVRCDSQAALAGARLRITDSKNAEADLPLTSSCGRYTAVLNGEIYNHRDVRRALPPKTYRTQSDTETLIEAFCIWGPDCAKRFEGMFAFAVYDRETRTLHAARDPAGQKPFYYLQDENAFVFASDINALLADPYRRKNFCPLGLSEFVSQRMICGADTHIREIRKLPGGMALTVTADGSIKTSRYYTIPVDEAATPENEAAASIHENIAQAVAQTSEIEHPAGLMLSGGIDSTGLLALLQKNGVAPRTYSIGFNDFTGDDFGIPTSFNEFEYARFAASHYQTEHTEISLSPAEYMDAITSWANMMGEPLEATEAPLLLTIFQRMAKDGLRLAYGGSGPDEIFDGYGLGPSLINAQDIPSAYFNKFTWLFEVKADTLLSQHHAAMTERAISKLSDMIAPYQGQTHSHAQLAQFINFHGRLQTYEFNELDLTSANNSIEARSPLIARGIIQSAFSFDPALKRRNDVSKWIYKESWRGVIPDKIIDRPKSGFETPIQFWFTDLYESAVQDTLLKNNSALLSLDLVDADYLKECWSKRDPAYRSIFYRLFCLNLMLERQNKLMSSSLNTPDYRRAA